MKERLSPILEIPVEHLNIKATTCEAWAFAAGRKAWSLMPL